MFPKKSENTGPLWAGADHLVTESGACTDYGQLKLGLFSWDLQGNRKLE